MRYALLLAAAFLGLTFFPAARADEDDPTDRTVLNKRASEWLSILGTHKEVKWRRAALIALGQAGPATRNVFQGVGDALRRDEEVAIRKSAAQVLGKLGEQARDPDRIDKYPIDPGLEALAHALSKDKSAAVREAAAAALGQIGPDAKATLKDLAAALKDESVAVRAAAADSLGRMGKEVGAAVLALGEAIRANKGKDGLQVRLYAVTAISRIGEPAGQPAAPALIDLLNEPPLTDLSPTQQRLQADTRRKAVEALGRTGAISSLGPLAKVLEKAMKDGDVAVARAAMTAINLYGPERYRVLPVLKEALKAERDRYVRCQAMHALGQIGGQLGSKDQEEIVAGLRGALTDKINDVRLAAILSLGELGPGVLGKQINAVRADLRLAARSGQRAIREAAEATLKQLDKQP